VGFLRWIVGVLGHPRSLVVCVAVVVLSWATVKQTGVTWTPDDDVLTPRLGGLNGEPEPRHLGIELRTNAAGQYELVRAAPGDRRQDSERDTDLLTLSEWRYRWGMWAPTREHRLMQADFSVFVRRSDVSGVSSGDRTLQAMQAVPQEVRRDWKLLWSADGQPCLMGEAWRTVWWGHAWNGVTLLALAGFFAWPIFAMIPKWEARRRRLRGLCARCGYQVRTDAGALQTCPECGLKSPA